MEKNYKNTKKKGKFHNHLKLSKIRKISQKQWRSRKLQKKIKLAKLFKNKADLKMEQSQQKYLEKYQNIKIL